MSKMLEIVIVDDHKIFREGLGFIISNYGNIKIIGEASNGKEFLEILNEKKPDIVFMDINMPVMDGIEATKYAIEKYPDLNIVALSMFGDESNYFKMINAGVKGFILKESGGTEIKEAIDDILSGKNYFSQNLLRQIIFKINNKKGNSKNPLNNFTHRELEILNLICNGLSNDEIADKLHLSQRTIEGHKSNLIKKTKVRNTINLIMYAIKNELVEM